jgi:hypothetical protein
MTSLQTRLHACGVTGDGSVCRNTPTLYLFAALYIDISAVKPGIFISFTSFQFN